MIFKTTARLAAAIVLTASAVAAPAMAQSASEPIGVTVSYRDLDLNHAAGAAVLLRRLQAAAEQACGGAPDPRVLGQRPAFEQCRNDAVSHAVAKLNAPLLTAAAQSGAVTRVALR